MTRFSFRGDVTNGFGDKPRNFRVMAENQEGLDAWIAKMGNVVNDAMSVLQAAITATDGQESTEAIATYFLTGPTPSGKDRETVKNTLSMTLKGLTLSRMGVKIHDQSAMNVPNEMAFVRPRDFTSARQADQKKPHQNIRVKDGLRQPVGAVHIAKAALDKGGKFTTRVMVHESTHKFASTRDHSYYSVPEGVQLKLMTKDQALENADSYALYAMTVGYALILPTVNW